MAAHVRYDGRSDAGRLGSHEGYLTQCRGHETSESLIGLRLYNYIRCRRCIYSACVIC